MYRIGDIRCGCLTFGGHGFFRWILPFECREDGEEPVIKEREGPFSDVVRYAVTGFGDSAGDGSDGVAVTADGNGISDGVFKTDGFKERFQCLGDGFLASLIEFIGIPDAVQGEIDGVIVPVHVTAELFFAHARARKEYRYGCGFSAFEALFVIVADGSDSP